MQKDEAAAFDEAFDAVEGGESFVINLRGRPLVALIPYDEYLRLKAAVEATGPVAGLATAAPIAPDTLRPTDSEPPGFIGPDSIADKKETTNG